MDLTWASELSTLRMAIVACMFAFFAAVPILYARVKLVSLRQSERVDRRPDSPAYFVGTSGIDQALFRGVSTTPVRLDAVPPEPIDIAAVAFLIERPERWVPAMIVQLACNGSIAVVETASGLGLELIEHPSDVIEGREAGDLDAAVLLALFGAKPQNNAKVPLARTAAIDGRFAVLLRHLFRHLGERYLHDPDVGDPLTAPEPAESDDRSGATEPLEASDPPDQPELPESTWLVHVDEGPLWRTSAMALSVLGILGGVLAISLELRAEPVLAVLLVGGIAILLGVDALSVRVASMIIVRRAWKADLALAARGRSRPPSAAVGTVSSHPPHLNAAATRLRMKAIRALEALRSRPIDSAADAEHVLPWAVLIEADEVIERFAIAVTNAGSPPSWYRVDRMFSRSRFISCVEEIGSRMSIPVDTSPRRA